MELAIANNQLVTFQIDDDIFGIDIMMTQEILKLNQIRRVPNSPFFFEGMLDLRGSVIPVISFKKLFDFGTFDLSRDKGVIIIRLDTQKVGIVIDKILRVITFDRDIVKRVPEGFSKTLKQFILGVVNHDEDLIAILDVQAILQLTSKELINGNEEESQALSLDFRRYKYDLLTQGEEKEIYKFLSSVNFSLNKVGQIGVLTFFSRLKIKTKTPVSKLIAKFKSKLDEDQDSTFSLEKSHYFFNQEEDYLFFLELMEHMIIPRKQKQGTIKIKIVNMDCGRGLEVYSLLFILKAFIPDFDKWDISIVGVDSSYQDLTLAKDGIFEAEHLRKLHKSDYLHFLDDLNDGRFQVKAELREKVEFHYGTVKNFEPFQDVDLFFCRKILLQLDDTDVDRVSAAIKQSLSLYGVLLLTQVEDLLLVKQALDAREINGRSYYINI